MGRIRILLRVDGGKRIGFGHWSRSMFLISCFRNVDSTLEVLLYTRNSQEFREAFPEAGIKVQPLEEENEFFRAIGCNDILLLDGYFFSTAYLDKLKEKGALIVYVDDLLQPGLNVDVVINHGPGVNPGDYLSPAPYSSFYLGSNFSMVSELFKRNIKGKGKPERLNNLFFCMGGADPTNETDFLLSKYHSFLKEYQLVYIVLGKQYQFSGQLIKKWEGVVNFRFLVGLNKEQISQLMQECGVAILPASTMAVEYAHIGGLLGIIQTADNQEKMWKGLLDEGVGVRLPEVFGTKDKAGLYKGLMEQQAQIFDGKSKERFIKLFKELALQQAVVLRAANVEDTSLTYRWASDKKIRAFSFSQEAISWEEHLNWFNKKLKDPKCVYLIGEVEGKPLGSIRFDVHLDEAVISYLVDSAWQGKGLGRIMLAEGIKELLATGLNFKTISGFVLKENTASLLVFERMGFEKSEHEGRLKYFKKVAYEKEG